MCAETKDIRTSSPCAVCKLKLVEACGCRVVANREADNYLSNTWHSDDFLYRSIENYLNRIISINKSAGWPILISVSLSLFLPITMTVGWGQSHIQHRLGKELKGEAVSKCSLADASMRPNCSKNCYQSKGSSFWGSCGWVKVWTSPSSCFCILSLTQASITTFQCTQKSTQTCWIFQIVSLPKAFTFEGWERESIERASHLPQHNTNAWALHWLFSVHCTN